MPTPEQDIPAQRHDPAVARACRTCTAPMQPGQDWCLSCGTAAPGRLGGRPGWRTVNSVATLTLVLVTGAVAASYAALSGDASSEAGRAAPQNATPIPGQVAQVPDAPPPVAPPAPVTPATTVPKVVRPRVVPAAPATPVTPSPAPAPATPRATPPPTPRPPATSTPKTPPAPALAPIEFGADTVAKYDPGKRITRSGDPLDAYDGNVMTAWSVTTPADGFPMQVGLLVDLESPKAVKEVSLGTTTPGGRVEVYGAAGSALPPDILDTRWEHVASQGELDTRTTTGDPAGDHVQKIRLQRGGGRFRYVLLWFTRPPPAGPTVRVTEFKLFG